jgi:hypothetical protein
VALPSTQRGVLRWLGERGAPVYSEHTAVLENVAAAVALA